MADPKTYTAPHAVYVDSVFHKADTPFVTASKPGKDWEQIGGVEKAAAEASDKTLDVHPSLESLDITALRAMAAVKNVETTVNGKQMNKTDLITAIAAVDEPAL